MYHGILDVLEQHDASDANILTETVFLADPASLAEIARKARAETMPQQDRINPVAAKIEIGQRPLEQHAHLAISIHAFIPSENNTSTLDRIDAELPCNCSECAATHGTLLTSDNHSRFYTGAIYGSGENAYEQTLSMFESAKRLLTAAGMRFTDVARTWIYLREMERDYPLLNTARREFFESNDIVLAPASTGIGAGLVPEGHDICLVLYAEKGGDHGQKIVMKTPTLNEAPSYGADFSRGLRITSYDNDLLLVSGTASLDASGSSIHPDDAKAQADRMLLNIAELLKAQGADYSHIVSAITYIKHVRDSSIIMQQLKSNGFSGFPHSSVIAEVCRPELLCETEVLAVLPRQ